MKIAFELLIIHYIADFIFQDEKWATNKYNSIKALLSHTVTYSYVFLLLIVMFPNILVSFNGLWGLLAFIFFIFIGHTAVDFVTSKIVHNKFEKKQYGSPIPNFGAFSMIGLDQLIHFGMIFYTYYLFKGI